MAEKHLQRSSHLVRPNEVMMMVMLIMVVLVVKIMVVVVKIVLLGSEPVVLVVAPAEESCIQCLQSRSLPIHLRFKGNIFTNKC